MVTVLFNSSERIVGEGEVGTVKVEEMGPGDSACSARSVAMTREVVDSSMVR